jgi:hypothetical protein
MKVKKAFVFFACLLFVPMIVVVPNMLKNGVTLVGDKEALSTHYFSTDILEAWVSKIFLDRGVSVRPGKVRLGRDGWLFLGDDYSHVYSSSIGHYFPANKNAYLVAHQAINEWTQVYEARAIEGPFITIAPNKHSIYWNYLVEDLKKPPLTSTDRLMNILGDKPKIIDLREPFLLLKDSESHSMYYQTDTHWNGYGAAEAYKVIRDRWGAVLPDVHWLQESDFSAITTSSKSGGDLAKFLKLGGYLEDLETGPGISFPLGMQVQAKGFLSNKVVVIPDGLLFSAQRESLLVTSIGALNKKRVLWLRDSFGTQLSPLFTATFNQVIHWHYDQAYSKGRQVELRQILDEFLPEIVIMTVVERDAIYNLGKRPNRDVFNAARL